VHDPRSITDKLNAAKSPSIASSRHKKRRPTRSEAPPFDNSLCFLCQTSENGPCNSNGDNLVQVGQRTGHAAGNVLKTIIDCCAVDDTVARLLGVGLDTNEAVLAAMGSSNKTLQYHNCGACRDRGTITNAMCHATLGDVAQHQWNPGERRHSHWERMTVSRSIIQHI